MKEQFIGYWRLTNWEATLDGKFHSHPFGEKAEGELLYSENGRMFASLSYAEPVSYTHLTLPTKRIV